MIKKLFLLSLVASQLMVSCSSDELKEETPTEQNQTLAEQIANLVKQPYSKLTPAEQKVKLEAEANEMLVQLDKSKSSGAIEAIQNLGRLLGLRKIDIFNGKNDNAVEDILNVSGVYGIYTWDNTAKIWVKTASTTELKFVFPAKASQTANNAVFSAKSTSSDIKVKSIDTYGSWKYDPVKQQYIQSPSVYDYFFLPTTADATLTIDNAPAATFTQTAKYSNKKEIPDDFAYKMTLNDGYAWEMSGKKALESTSKAAFTFNGKTLVDFNAGSTANIDGLLENSELVQYRGKANGLIKLMDNFIIVANMDLATEAADDIALDKSIIRPAYITDNTNPKNDYKAYYTALNAYEKKYSEGLVALFNKNIKLILVSKKDGTKIADIIQHSEARGKHTFNLPVWNEKDKYWSWGTNQGESFSQPYMEEIYYLKFSDNTEVEMSTYFSEGFGALETKFENFVKAFQR
ncbi:hypothetical protein [Flavobacterium sp.]|uniref:hypothetical protein n=1 Tax=Flavobacterium sp. TaxID=239 RepID=UPI0025BF4305|nr:hypothetical protein [Flavobacterium sp.]